MKHWDLNEIRTYSTAKIIKQLAKFGVAFTTDEFLEAVKEANDGSEIADQWFEQYPIRAHGLDEDFLWMAATVLWERLAPDEMSSAKLDKMMQAGYQLADVEACIIWLELWEELKSRFTPAMKSIAKAEAVFSGVQFLQNWCQELALKLGNAGRKNPIFYEKQLIYCEEFCRYFPATDWQIIHNMKMAQAECYFGLGNQAAGDQAFEAIIAEFPDVVGSYIGWGDMYYLFHLNPAIPRDYERAKQIYQMGVVSDRRVVLERLKTIENEQRRRGNPASM